MACHPTGIINVHLRMTLSPPHDALCHPSRNSVRSYGEDVPEVCGIAVCPSSVCRYFWFFQVFVEIPTAEHSETHPCAARKGLGNRGFTHFSRKSPPIQNIRKLKIDECQRNGQRTLSCCFPCPANAGFSVFRG